MKDEEIVELFWKRSEDAVEETQRAYKNYCGTIAFQIVGSREDAEECVNDALAAAWNSIPPQKPEDLKTYMGKLTREISISRRRRERAQKRTPGEYQVSLEEIGEVAADRDLIDELDSRALAEEISRFLWTLPEEQRDLFVRRYWYGDSIEAACRRFGIGQSKAKVSLKRTRDRLRDHLIQRGYLV